MPQLSSAQLTTHPGGPQPPPTSTLVSPYLFLNLPAMLIQQLFQGFRQAALHLPPCPDKAFFVLAASGSARRHSDTLSSLYWAVHWARSRVCASVFSQAVIHWQVWVPQGLRTREDGNHTLQVQDTTTGITTTQVPFLFPQHLDHTFSLFSLTCALILWGQRI